MSASPSIRIQQAETPSAFTRARLVQVDGADGWQWQVLIIKPGMGANRQYFPAATLKQAVKKFDGARVFCLPDGQHSKSGDKSAQHIVGWITEPHWEEGQGLTGRLTLMQSAGWLRQNLLDSHAKGKPDLYGLSIDCPGRGKPELIEGQQAMVVKEVLDPVTVDVVWNPGTPGGFQRVLNAVQLTKEERMNREELIKVLQAKRPDLLEGKDVAAISMEDLSALLEKALAEPAPVALKQAVDLALKQAEADKAKKDKADAERAKQTGGLSDDDRTTLRQAKVLAWNQQAVERITQSQLPEKMQDSLRARFLDEPGELVKLDQAIKDYRQLYDGLSEEGKVKGLGFAHSLSSTPQIERLQQAMDKMFGLDVKGDEAPFLSIRQAYVRITGDVELNGRSTFNEAVLAGMMRAAQAFHHAAELPNGNMKEGFFRIEQAQLAGVWPLILGNSMYRRLMKKYDMPDYGEDRLISTVRSAADYKTIESMRPHTTGDLPVVVADADYTEMAQANEEGVSYAVATRGRILTISRRVIINDDLMAVLRLVDDQGEAARRTHARFVWAFFMNNATYDGDAVAWFHASHGNLGSTALTANAAGVAALTAGLDALMNMTAPGSGEKIGAAWWNAKPVLAVPTVLQSVAKQINQSSGIPGAANQGDNPVYKLFGNPEAPERIVVNPLFTDATDWGVFRQAGEIGLVEMAYLRGQQKPEMFVADNPSIGQMFLADKTQFKIRHEYGGELEDFRGGYKAVVDG